MKLTLIDKSKYINYLQHQLQGWHQEVDNIRESAIRLVIEPDSTQYIKDLYWAIGQADAYGDVLRAIYENDEELFSDIKI